MQRNSMSGSKSALSFPELNITLWRLAGHPCLCIFTAGEKQTWNICTESCPQVCPSDTESCSVLRSVSHSCSPALGSALAGASRLLFGPGPFLDLPLPGVTQPFLLAGGLGSVLFCAWSYSLLCWHLCRFGGCPWRGDTASGVTGPGGFISEPQQ